MPITPTKGTKKGHAIARHMFVLRNHSNLFACAVLTTALLAGALPAAHADIMGNAGGGGFASGPTWGGKGGRGNGGGGAGGEYQTDPELQKRQLDETPAAVDGKGADGTLVTIGTAGGVGDRGLGGGLGGTSVGQDVMTITGGAGGEGRPVINEETGNSYLGGSTAGGGGGGAGLLLNNEQSVLKSGSAISGGLGGNGANSGYKWGSGGGGGGGAGIILRRTSLTNEVGSIITGGNGGNAGGTWNDPIASSVAYTGGGGGGGDGIVVETGSKLKNFGQITGGKGGLFDQETSRGYSGKSGSGVRVGESAYVINAGLVAAGEDFGGSEGSDLASAIDFVGSNSTLELWNGSDIQGNVVVADGVENTTLVLGGAQNSSFDAAEIGTKYNGFTNFRKTGASEWKVAGVADESTPWVIAEGVLSIADDGSLGAVDSALAIDGGTLAADAAFDISRAIVIGDNNGTIDTRGNTNTVYGIVSGNGELTKQGEGTLLLSAANSFEGDVIIAKGVLALSGEGSIASAKHINNNGMFDIADIDADSASIKSIEGGADANIRLGDKKLIITDAKGDAFAGLIEGSGSFALEKGKQILAGDNTYTGDTTIGRQAALQLGDANRAGTLTSNVINEGLLSGQGSMNDLVNQGIVHPGVGDTFGTLTVNGDYVGDNGKLILNSALGDDNSATDRLIVKGSTSGSTEVQVVNRDGMGASTVNGIKVIEVGGKSDGQFNLIGDYVNYKQEQAVVAGAYAYTLNKGSAASSEDGNWYLRSENKDGKHGNTDETGGDDSKDSKNDIANGGNDAGNKSGDATNRNGGSDRSTGGNNGNRNSGNGKEYQVGVPVYSGVNATIGRLNRSGFGSMVSRMDMASGDTGSNAQSSSGAGTVWGRMQTGYTRLNPTGNATGAIYGSHDWTMQAGLDGKFVDDENGELFGSLWLDYTRSSVRTHSDVGSGRLNVKGFGLGGALTWFGESGYYIDGQGKATWYKSDLESDQLQQALAKGVKSFGYALSLEAGQKIAVTENWSVTPQAQLIWSSLNTNNYVDVFSAAINTPNNDALTGRFGIAVNNSKSWQEADGTRTSLQFGGIANIYQDLKSGSNYITVSDVKVATGATDKTWGELGLTANYAWQDDTYSLFGKVSTATSLQNAGKSYSVMGNVGFNVKW